MKLTKRGPYYWVDFRGPDGKRHRISTRETDETAAYTKAGVIVRAAMVPPGTPAVDPRLTLCSFIDFRTKG